ncbi:DUF6284 family protein [Streptomyces roseoverticillatus]|uniref:DUF6284 family protein n=1 Tax=Streptomyces roseoverticillatus TaxID=66429 RepID=UPI0035AB6BFE
MNHIIPDPARAAGSVLPESELEPTRAELDAIEQEMPLIEAEMALLDVEIALLDRPLTGMDVKRLRRAERRALDEIIRWLTNRAAAGSEAA